MLSNSIDTVAFLYWRAQRLHACLCILFPLVVTTMHTQTKQAHHGVFLAHYVSPSTPPPPPPHDVCPQVSRSALLSHPRFQWFDISAGPPLRLAPGHVYDVRVELASMTNRWKGGVVFDFAELRREAAAGGLVAAPAGLGRAAAAASGERPAACAVS